MKQFLFLSFVIFFTSILYAQSNRAGKFGIGYSGNLSSSTNAITTTIWADNSIAIEPQFGLNRVELKNSSATMYRLGLGMLYNLSESEILPYLGFRITAAVASGENASYTDMIYSLVFGGEYFISDHFSAGAEVRLNYANTDEGFSPLFNIEQASIITTEQVLNLKLYF
ncbi:MAG: hypothetical protein IPM56_07345 [Ignavibacteriales bacterium]|nr:MAG: hypothetical protein IPM56_07345 [Ignavibacteriales bacterium]